MGTRIKSGLLMLPLLAVVWAGGYVLLAGCAMLSVFAVREFYRAFETAEVDMEYAAGMGYADRKIRPSFRVGLAGIILLYGIQYLFIGQILWVAVCVVMSLALLFLKGERSLADSLITMAGLFYVAFFLSFIYRIDFEFGPMYFASINPGGLDFSMLDHPGSLAPGIGFYIHGFKYNFVWLVIFAAFATDVFAYFVGSKFGKRKLAPRLSPKKTVEGGVGGMVGSTAVCGLFGYFAMPEYLVHCIVIGAIGSIAAQAGDLAASAIKRRLGLKDYGKLIPGHGGLLDRIDSILFTAPFVYIYLAVIRAWTVNGDMHTPVFGVLRQVMDGTVDSSLFDVMGRGF